MFEPIKVTTTARFWGKSRDPHRLCRADADVAPDLEIEYRADDPLGISVAGWMFLREHIETALLDQCADAPFVHIHRESNELRFWMRGGDGEATFWVPRPVVRAFFERTVALVPFGQEFKEFDWSGLLRWEGSVDG